MAQLEALPMIGDVNLFFKGARGNGDGEADGSGEEDDDDDFEVEVEIMIAGACLPRPSVRPSRVDVIVVVRCSIARSLIRSSSTPHPNERGPWH